MSKITQIEQALLSMDPAQFQRLCDAYLHARGYDRINAVGLVTGADKVKRGTPDTFVPLDDGTYLFAEYTTQQTGVGDKLLADMEKCFDESKTGIPGNLIREFVACHTSELSPAEAHALIEAGRAKGCIVSVFGAAAIAHDLVQRYPGIARDYLGIEVDTGQIVSVDEFVTAYGRNALATPLDTVIRFRDEEIEQALDALEGGDLLMLSGGPGVGKSRLAIECCRRFVQKHDDFQLKCIFNRGWNLFDDLRVYFTRPGSYLILVDDANRVGGFDYILQLLHEQNDERRIKIVTTVRDYALDKVLAAARPYGGGVSLQISPLNDEQIRDIVSDSFGIRNHLYLERISDVARGNPRIAIMMAQIAVRENSLQGIADVSSVYEEYFRSIRDDLTDLRDPELLRAAGIVSLFRHVDRNSDKQAALVTSVFRVEWARFWSSIERLHELEVIDLYENEVAKISDQVLATFVFHLAFFGERALDVDALFHEQLFPAYRSRIFDALNPALDAFDASAMAEQLTAAFRRRWKELDDSGDDAGLMHLVDAFGALDQTATLVLVRDRVRAMKHEPLDLSSIAFKPTAGSRPSLWSILNNFRNSDLETVRAALQLVVELIAKRPKEMPEALSVLMESYGMKHTSYFHRFQVQRAVIDILWDWVAAERDRANALAANVFITVAEPLLHTHFDTHDSKRELAIIIRKFDVPATPELMEMRSAVWTHIGDLLRNASTRPIASEFIRRHANAGYRVADPVILSDDANVILPILAEVLDPSDYTDCSTVQAYLRLLRRSRVEETELMQKLRRDFVTRTYELAELLLDDFEDIAERAELGWQEYQRVKNDRLLDHVKEYNLEDFDQLITDCLVISDDLSPLVPFGTEANRRSRDDYSIKISVTMLIEHLGSRDQSLFEEVVGRYLDRGNPLELMPHGILARLIEVRGVERAYTILTEHEFPRKQYWLGAFLMVLPRESIAQAHVEMLYELYATADSIDLPWNIDFITNYEGMDARVIPRIVEKLVERTTDDPTLGSSLSALLDGGGQLGGRLVELFGGSPEDIGLLKAAYFVASNAREHIDYHAETFNVILDLDSNFGVEWVDWMYEKAENGWLSRHDDSRDYSRLWLRDDYMMVMRTILERIRQRETDGFGVFSYGQVFMRVVEGGKENDTIHAHQDNLMKSWIAECPEDTQAMSFVFGLASELAPERRRELLATFLQHNKKFTDFEALALEPNHWGWSGSEVPLLQKRVEFFQSLLPLMSTIDLLNHKLRVERHIDYLRERIESEKRNDFMES